jgi:MoxR-like ATPase
MLVRAARAWAAASERDYVTPDDVKALAPAVLVHRIIASADASMTGRSPAGIVEELLSDVPVPLEESP